MPGLILFRRRWAIAADDLVLPSIVLMLSHLTWAALELAVFLLVYDQTSQCSRLLQIQAMGYTVVCILAACLESCVIFKTFRGAIMDTKIRKAVRPYLYARCALFLLECGWMISTAVWLGFCPFFPAFVESVLLGTMIFNAVLVLLIGIGLYLSYDLGGGKWLKLRKYQTNLQATGSKLHHGHHHRTWRTRKTAAAYHISWQKRCRFLFCCLGTDQRASLASIAQLLSDFFRDLDLVPTDIIAGLILLRRYQKLRRYALLTLDKENTFQFLSATPITPETKFLKLSDTTVRTEYERLVRYMRFSLAVYGWPMYVCRGNPCRKLIDVIPGLRCVCCFGAEQPLSGLDIEEDNCCGCHSSAMWAVMHSLAEDDSVQFVHASYTGGVGMTPYFLALDHLEKKIVVTIRGTLSMKDLVTDLNADAEFIPVNPLQTNPPWLAHKGMISAAEYVKKRLIEEGKLAQMLDIAKARTGKHYDLMVVGHSLGAGAAAILAILLKPDFPTLKCICFSPPGGLLNLPVAEYTKTFITTCFLGKDVVTRLGLHQLEAMRADLLSVIQRSTTPKWRILLSSLFGCSPSEPSLQQFAEEQARSMSTSRRKPAVSPFMTTHPPMYLPGKIVQIVRSYPKQQKFGKTLSRVCCTKSQRTGHPAYQAIEVHRESFYEVCLSPSMLDDHMPDTLLNAMEKVLDTKPTEAIANGTGPSDRQYSNSCFTNASDELSYSAGDLQEDTLPYRTARSVSTVSSFGPFEDDMGIPYTDLGDDTPYFLTNRPRSTTQPQGVNSNRANRKQSPTSMSENGPPSVQIYASTADAETSCYTLSMFDTDSMISGSGGAITPDIHRLNLPGQSASRFLTTPTGVFKTKSMTELPDDPQLSPKPRRSMLSVGNLDVPSRPRGYRRRRSRAVSIEMVSRENGQVESHLCNERLSSQTSSYTLPLPATTPVSFTGSFSSLPDKTHYGTIHYV